MSAVDTSTHPNEELIGLFDTIVGSLSHPETFTRVVDSLADTDAYSRAIWY